MIKKIEKVVPYIKNGKHSTWVHSKFPGVNYEYAVLFTDKTKGLFSSKKEISPFKEDEKVKVEILRAKQTKDPNHIGNLKLKKFNETFDNPYSTKTKTKEEDIANLATSTAIAIYIATTEHLDFKNSDEINKLKQIAVKIAPVIDEIKKAVMFELTKDK